MACYESQVRDKLEVDPRVAKAFWGEINLRLDTGMDPVKAIEDVAKKAGLENETVGKILVADKRLKAMTRDMSYRLSKVSQVKQAAQDLVDRSDKPLPLRVAQSVWDASRRSLTFGHGGVFPFTHARNMLYRGFAEQKIFAKMVKNAYSYADLRIPGTQIGTKAGEARWAQDMRDLQLRSSFKPAERAGLEIGPMAEPTGILTKGIKGWGRRGFDSLKIARLDLWDLYSEKFPDMLKDEVSARALANEINLQTGALKKGSVTAQISSKLSNVSFAPKLFIARRLEALTPLRNLAKAGQMTAGERVVSRLALKSWAKTVLFTVASLEANDAINKAVGSNRRINWTDFSHPGSLWRYNIGGSIVPASPLLEVIRTPVAALGAFLKTKKELRGEKPMDAAWSILTKDILNAVHPSISNVAELLTGREQFGVPGKERRLPFRGVKQLLRGEEKEKVAPMTGTEYLLEKGPIPVSAATRQFVQALQDEGVDPNTANNWVKALLHSSKDAFMSGALGLHTHPEQTQQPARKRRFRPNP